MENCCLDLQLAEKAAAAKAMAATASTSSLRPLTLARPVILSAAAMAVKAVLSTLLSSVGAAAPALAPALAPAAVVTRKVPALIVEWVSGGVPHSLQIRILPSERLCKALSSVVRFVMGRG